MSRVFLLRFGTHCFQTANPRKHRPIKKQHLAIEKHKIPNTENPRQGEQAAETDDPVALGTTVTEPTTAQPVEAQLAEVLEKQMTRISKQLIPKDKCKALLTGASYRKLRVKSLPS